jgi:hypothetical protein
MITAVLVVTMGMFAYLTLAPSVSAASNNNAQTLNLPCATDKQPNIENNAMNDQCQQKVDANLSVGQTFTLTSTQGAYKVIGNSSETGVASGTLTFNVTGKLTQGYILSLTSGSFEVNGTTYTVTSGSAQTGPYAQHLTGQGETSPSGQFLISASASGNFGGATSQVKLDFSDGTTEYGISLTCSVQG